MTMTRHEIELSSNKLLSEGGGRHIYAHPENPDIVIKLHKPLREKPLQALRTLFRPKRRRFGRLLNSVVEIDAFSEMVARTGRVPAFVTQFLGFIATNRGPGAMFEAIRGADGALAPTLENHARNNPVESGIEVAIDKLWDQIVEFRAIVSDPTLRNAVVTGDAANGYRLTLVDGLGERTLIPIMSWSKRAHAAQCKLARHTMKQDYKAQAQRP
jgi:hypothetical protein